MGEQQNGVTITLREIYDSVQEIGFAVKRFEEQAKRLDDGIQKIHEIEEKSTKALDKAEQALSAVQEIKGNLGKINIGILLALVGGAIGTLFYFVQH